MIQELSRVRPAHLRKDIYYWKCDRPAAFHGTLAEPSETDLEPQILPLLQSLYPGHHVTIQSGGGQGNHRTYKVRLDDEERFLRIEDGPEADDYIETESRVQQAVRDQGLATPKIFAADASRSLVPFAWQLMETVPHPDLNHWHKQGLLDLPRTAREIGAAVARWQDVAVDGYGPFQPGAQNSPLRGYHRDYTSYFWLHLDRHLNFLSSQQFLTSTQADEIHREIQAHASLLDLPCGCLVHKDLALWNILGTPQRIAAFIDWDDAISGDPMDDLSLLGCFYPGDIIHEALAGYVRFKPLPAEHRRRFWLHLLRNMLVKAVIRVGAGYFDRTDGFFLIGSGSTGADLRTSTQTRIAKALQGLRDDACIESL